MNEQTLSKPAPLAPSLGALRASMLRDTSLRPMQAPSPEAITARMAGRTFQTERRALNALMTSGIEAARALIANPAPYKIDAHQLRSMVDAIEAIRSTPDVGEIELPAETYSLMQECIRADKVRKLKRGDPATVIEAVSARAAAAMFSFSNVRGVESDR